MPSLPNVYEDQAVYNVLEVFGLYGPCDCFMFSPYWDGHDVNPPCLTVTLAREVVEAVRKADK